jgi:hypothetical protein
VNSEPGELQLQPLELWFQPGTGPLLPQVRAALGRQARRSPADAAAGFAEPLRWAITAVDPERGLRLEAVMLIGPAVEPG